MYIDAEAVHQNNKLIGKYLFNINKSIKNTCTVLVEYRLGFMF